MGPRQTLPVYLVLVYLKAISGQLPYAASGAGSLRQQQAGLGTAANQYQGLANAMNSNRQVPVGQAGSIYPGQRQTASQYPQQPQPMSPSQTAVQLSGQYPSQTTGQLGSQYPGQATGQFGSQYPAQATGQLGGQYPGQTGRQMGGQYPQQSQYPGQSMGVNPYAGQNQQNPYAGQMGGQFPRQQQGPYPGQYRGQYPGQAMGQQGIGSSCPAMVVPPYGRFLQGPCSNSAGSRCYLTCDPGFDVVGSCFRVCNNGRWSGTEMICAKTSIRCPPLNVSPGLRMVEGCQNMAGFTCRFGCLNGQMPMGQQVIYCTAAGQWSAPPPTCSSSMGRGDGGGMLPMQGGMAGDALSGGFLAPDQGGMRQDGLSGGTGIPNQGDMRQNGLSGRRQSSCPPIQPPMNGAFVEPCLGAIGSVCQIACQRGFSLQGSSSMTCTQTGWSSRPGNCIRSSANGIAGSEAGRQRHRGQG